MNLLEEVWKQVSPFIYPYIVGRQTVEFGCNICTDDGEKFYIANMVYGDMNEVNIDINPCTVGTFHTHINDNPGFSPYDINTAIKNKERFMYVSTGMEIIAFDMDRYSKTIKRMRKTTQKYKDLANRINRRAEIYYW